MGMGWHFSLTEMKSFHWDGMPWGRIPHGGKRYSNCLVPCCFTTNLITCPIHFRSISIQKKYGVLWFLDWGNSSDIKGCLQGIPPKKIEAMIFTHPRRPEEDLRLQIKVPWRTEVSPPIVDPGGYVLNTSPLVLKKMPWKETFMKSIDYINYIYIHN